MNTKCVPDNMFSISYDGMIDHSFEVSGVLAAALKKMDDIIAGSNEETWPSQDIFFNTSCDTPDVCSQSKDDVESLQKNTSYINAKLEELKETILSKDDSSRNPSQGEQLDISSATFILEWLTRNLIMKDKKLSNHTAEDDGSSGKVQELESDKKKLILQASVLVDQVEAQADKISELEKLLDQRKEEIIHLEKNFHQEVIAHSTVENNRLELITELTSLRLRLTAAERDRRESDDKCRRLENQLVTYQSQISDQNTESAFLPRQIFHNGTAFLAKSDGYEIEKLKTVLDSVMLSNDEKDKKIQDLCQSLKKCKKLTEIVLSNQTKKAIDSSSQELSETDMKSLKNVSLIDKQQTILANPTVLNSSLFRYNPDICGLPRSNSAENISSLTTKVASANFHYGTIPRQSGNHVLSRLQSHFKDADKNSDLSSTILNKIDPVNDCRTVVIQNNYTTNSGESGGKSSTVTFGKGFLKLKSGNRCSSEPFLGGESCIMIPSAENQHDNISLKSHSLIKPEKDKRGFFKFISRWKKTGSQNNSGDFKRGGIRATAGPRLGWCQDIPQNPEIPFSHWTLDMVTNWLHKLGLNFSVNDCKRNLYCGEKLMKASLCDYEKDLGIKNPLHKKKLLLSVKSMTTGFSNLPSTLQSLDYHWVVRWLDDIGLPQYKDAFTDARVDGYVLQFLTVDDLLMLKVTSQLHHASIRRGIQVLRENGFDPHCLIRRSCPNDDRILLPKSITLWTNHRVMEWLRTVDLSEYAPNLRGSGVHGGLIIYEAKFNTNLFATLLNIPSTKTLLRRHLATHFKQLIGEELIQLKRETETETPLSPNIKIKVARKPQFGLIKKRLTHDIENENYVCPMDIPIFIPTTKQLEVKKLVVRRNSDPSPQDQKQTTSEVNVTAKNEDVSNKASESNIKPQDENVPSVPTTTV